MIFGTIKFKCDNCGETFRGLNAEWRCTAIVAPVRCPSCGSWHTMPKGFWSPFSNKWIYKKIWKSIDENARISEL
jgi:DNA-directed RNA polymerase subunit RPC12/RpoP